MPKRIQLSRAKGWRLPDGAVVVSRPTKWGNPYVVGTHGTRAECLFYYRALSEGFWLCQPGLREAQEAAVKVMRSAATELRGKDLACWCRLDQACHADVLLEIANA